ncbi:MAG: T9SS type A sorting domain-containing protein [Bacteroidota bacterium]
MKIQIKPSFQIALLLTASLIFNIQSTNAQTTFPNPNIQYQLTHEGDLILTGNDTMIIENTSYIINGDLVLKDSSQLIIRQSIIDLSVKPGIERFIKLHGSSILQADTTIFGGIDLTLGINPSEVELLKPGYIITDNNSKLILNNCFSLNQQYLGNSVVTIRHSYLFQEPLGLIHVEGTADVLIEDSYVGAIFIGIPQNVPVVIDSLRPGLQEYWSAKESISDSLKYNLILRRTVVADNDKGYNGGIEMGWNIAADALRANLTISNSKLNRFLFGFPDNAPAHLSGLRIRQPVNIDFNNIHIINTEVQTLWGVFMEGGPAVIDNSEGLWIYMTGGDADVFVQNSKVGEIDPRNYTGTLIYDHSSWEGAYEIWQNSHIKIRGSVRMLPILPLFDQTATMTRTYDVILHDDLDGSPFNNVNLFLSKNGTAVWNGVTDAEGKASFDITFDYDNSEDGWILSTDANNINLNKTVSIFSSNPIIINLELEKDSIHYRSVIHVAGNPNFPFGTKESPYPNIQEAIDNSGGGIIYVHPGTYPGYIAPGETRGGITLKDSVTLIGAGADSTILTGGVNAESVSGAHISGFTIKDGIHTISTSMTITNCVVADFAGTAIWGSHSDFVVINNVLAGNSPDAIFLSDSCTAIIKNNIVVNNTGLGIAGIETASATIDYNDIWGNGENYFELFPAGEHDISMDPLFVDASGGDFHLQVGSPCIDAGDPAPQFNDPDGARNDMGAFGGPFAPDIVTSIESDGFFIPIQFELFQNYPNPFNTETKIHFYIPSSELVNLSIYNFMGQRVRTLLNEKNNAGRHTVSWDGKDEYNMSLGTGIYFYRISTNDFKYTRKALLLK